jgi:hypothetical protein
VSIHYYICIYYGNVDMLANKQSTNKIEGQVRTEKSLPFYVVCTERIIYNQELIDFDANGFPSLRW